MTAQVEDPRLSDSSVTTRVLGSVTPRLWTRPLRELTPQTSYGYDVIEFAKEIGRPLDPWQQWLVIHAGELAEDGAPRFRKVLVLVARQNGKTELCVILSLYWMFIERVEQVLGTSTKLPYAKESWRKAVALAKSHPDLNREIEKVTRANGEVELLTTGGSRYNIAASDEEGGRSKTINRLILDELRQHDSYDAWDAAVPATNAVWDAQVFAITNAGSDKSVVLNDLRDTALKEIEHGEVVDEELGMFEWSAPKGSDPEDPHALAQANPNLNRPGHGIRLKSLLNDARAAKAKGGEKLTGFKTENMCMRVPMMDPAIDALAWAACLDPNTMDGLRRQVAMCLDVSLDQQHVTLYAAALMSDGRVRVEPVSAWAGPFATRDARRDLPTLLGKARPRSFGWFPGGPGAALAAQLTSPKSGAPRAGWPPRGVTVEEIRGEVTAVCMGLADLVTAGQVAHSDDPLLNSQVELAERLMQGDVWRFTRKGAGHCDAVYACAGAVHLARVLPTGVGKPRVVLPR